MFLYRLLCICLQEGIQEYYFVDSTKIEMYHKKCTSSNCAAEQLPRAQRCVAKAL